MILIFEDKDENIIEDVFALLSEKIQNVQVCPDITFATLFFLANHPGWVFSRAQIYEAVWKEPGEYCGAAVTNVISQIRRKIGSNYITTVVGSGYRFEMG